MKKVLAFILSLAMLLSMSVTAFADGVETTVITDANSTEEAVQSWKQYYSGTGQMQMEPTFKAMLSLSDVASMEKYGDLDHQQFGVVKFSSGSGYKVRFSTSSTENITGYVGEYGSKQMPAWVPLAFSYNTQNMHATGGVSTVISSGDPVTLDLSFPETYGQGQNGAVYIGFALAEAPATDVSVTVTLLKKTHDNEPDEEIGSAVLNFTAASQQSEQTDTVTPTAVTIGGTFSDIIGDKTYRLHLNAGEQNEYRTAMNLIAALTPANATGEIVWSSADANIVTVSALQNNSYGATVTAVGAGKTTVTATIKGTNISDIITVKVFGKTAATVGDKKYETLADALEDAEDGSAITVDTAMTIGNVPVAAGSIVTATNSTETAVTSSAATVTPKTLTITNGTGESATKQTAKAYVVSSSGDSAKSAVVTDVKFAGNSNITKGAGASVENYVNVAQVLANAVAANATGDSPIDVSSISSMTLRLDKTDNTASATLGGNDGDVKTALQSKLDDSSITVYDVKPIATVTTATTTGGTTTTQTYDYDASKEVTGSFKFKLHVSDNSTDVGKTANLTHYHDDNGTWTATPIPGCIVDSDGNVTVELDKFSYITVDSLNATDFATLVANAEAGSTITLDADVALTNTVVIGKNLTINLNGHSITATDARALWVKSGDVTITGTGTVSAVVTEGTSLDSSSSVIRVGDIAANMNKAMLTIGENVTVSSPYCYGITAFGKNNTDGDLTTADIELVVNGTVSVSGVQAAVSGNGTNTLSATAMTINGTVTAANEYAIYHPGKGELTVNGTVSGLGGIEIKSGALTVGENANITATATEQSHSTNNNGTSTSGYAIAAVGNSAYVGDPAVTINGGTIIGMAITLAENNSENYGTITATSNNISIPDGYEWVTEGGVSTLKKSFVSTQVTDVDNIANVCWIAGTNLDLLSSIQLNVYLYVPASLVAQGAEVVVTFDGVKDETASKAVSLLDKDPTGTFYVVSRSLYAMEMGKDLTVQVKVGNDVQTLYNGKYTGTGQGYTLWTLEDGKTFSTDVYTYLDSLQNSNESAAWKSLAQEMKEYGQAAEVAFAEKSKSNG